MAEKKSSPRRSLYFATVVYPDSAPENWKSLLDDFHVSSFISPFHDSDVNATGEPKKPHYHVMLLFDSLKTEEQAKEVFSVIGGVGCEFVKSLRAYARYLCHLDNPDKVQYSKENVIALGGADYLDAIGSPSDKYLALEQMGDFCDKYNVVSFYALCRYAAKKRPDWHKILCDSGAVYVREMLRSRQWSIENGQLEIIDPETGEIL